MSASSSSRSWTARSLETRESSDLGSGAPAPFRQGGGNGSPPRPRGNGQAGAPRTSNGSPESMSEAQRRYLFRLMVGQGFHKEAAEEHLKDLFEVDSLTAVTKLQATELIDELLKGTAPRVEKGVEQRTLSISQIQTYLGCPLKYRFQYLDKLPARVVRRLSPSAPRSTPRSSGSTRTASPGGSAKLDGRPPGLRRRLVRAELGALGLLRAGVARLLTRRVERCSGSTWNQSGRLKPRRVEQPFELELADPRTGECLDVRLRGIVDLVEEDGTLVDFKTAGRTSNPVELERHLQLSTYALVHLCSSAPSPTFVSTCCSRRQKPRLERLPTSRSLEDLAWTARLIEQVAQAILTEHFFPNPSWRCARVRVLRSLPSLAGRGSQARQQSAHFNQCVMGGVLVRTGSP